MGHVRVDDAVKLVVRVGREHGLPVECLGVTHPFGGVSKYLLSVEQAVLAIDPYHNVALMVWIHSWPSHDAWAAATRPARGARLERCDPDEGIVQPSQTSQEAAREIHAGLVATLGPLAAQWRAQRLDAILAPATSAPRSLPRL